jgi:hypothetical protein
LSSALKLPGPPNDGASDEGPRVPVVALPPDPDRPFRPDLGTASFQLPFSEPASWLIEDRPSPKARCWVDAENADWCPEAMELHLATEAVYDQSQVFGVPKGRIGVRGE